MFKHKGLELSHFLLRERLANHPAFYFVDSLIEAIKDAVCIGFDLCSKVRMDFVCALALVNIFHGCEHVEESGK